MMGLEPATASSCERKQLMPGEAFPAPAVLTQAPGGKKPFYLAAILNP